jgi:hypothetical protein
VTRLPLLALALLTACSGATGGAQTVTDFETWLGRHPYAGVSVVDASTSEAIPYAGSADLTITADPATITGAVEHVCDFRPRDMNGVSFIVLAEQISVPVDCEDPAAAAETWAAAAAIDGLVSAAVADRDTAAVFADAESALAGWDALRRLPGPSYELQVSGGWTLTDDDTTTAEARTIAREALTSGTPVTRVLVARETAAEPESVTVEVSRGAARLQGALVAAHPAWPGVVQVSSSASSRLRTTSSPTSPITSR